MTPKELELVKKDYLKHIKKFMIESGSLVPHITIFAEHKKDNEFSEDKNKLAIVHIPIPDEYLKDDEAKDMFVDDVIPDMIDEVKKNFIPLGVAWASEAWVRTLDAGATDEQIKNYKKLPIKKEVVIVSIETEDKHECIIYDIIRKGMKVASDGDLVDDIELVEDESLNDIKSTSEGRFVGLYKKIK